MCKIIYQVIPVLYKLVCIFTLGLLPDRNGAHGVYFVFKAAALLALAEWCEVYCTEANHLKYTF